MNIEYPYYIWRQYKISTAQLNDYTGRASGIVRFSYFLPMRPNLVMLIKMTDSAFRWSDCFVHRCHFYGPARNLWSFSRTSAYFDEVLYNSIAFPVLILRPDRCRESKLYACILMTLYSSMYSTNTIALKNLLTFNYSGRFYYENANIRMII